MANLAIAFQGAFVETEIILEPQVRKRRCPSLLVILFRDRPISTIEYLVAILVKRLRPGVVTFYRVTALAGLNREVRVSHDLVQLAFVARDAV